jgi:hypothetical protein
MSRLYSVVVALALTAVSGVSYAETPPNLIPDGATSPFADWTVGAADSTWAQWDVFSTPSGTNAPDEGKFPNTGAFLPTVQEGSGGASGAFLTGGGNIYSFAQPTSFDVVVPNLAGKPASYVTRVVAQVHTLGSLIQQMTVQLTYNDGAPTTLAPAEATLALDIPAAGGFGGAEQLWRYVWDVPYSSANYLVEFGASSSSMSLAGVRVDTFTQDGVVPEPATIGLVGAAVTALVRFGRRVRC